MSHASRLLVLAVIGMVALTGVATAGIAPPESPQSTSSVDASPDSESVGPPNGTNGTATFEITSFSAPDNATAGQPVTVEATINNTGNASGSQVVEYQFNGSVADSRQVQLMSDQRRTVTFTLRTRSLSAGQYMHGVTTANDSVMAAINISQDDDGPVGNLSGDVADFAETTPLKPSQTSPTSLAGKLRVESSVASNTSVNLTRNSSTDYTLSINVTGNATNVTFYLQQQAVAASQNISNVTAYLDGQEFNFTTNQSHGQWLVFVVDHFSTRTVTFASTDELTARNIDDDMPLEDIDGDGTFGIVDVQALFANLNTADVQTNPKFFDFTGDGSVTVVDVQALFVKLHQSN